MRYVIPPLLAVVLLGAVVMVLRGRPLSEYDPDLYGPPSDHVLGESHVPPGESTPKPPPSALPRATSDQTDRALRLAEEADRLAAEGRFVEARDLYERAWQTAPDFVMALHGIALTYMGEQKYDEALDAWRRLERVLPAGSEFRHRILQRIHELEEIVRTAAKNSAAEK